MHNHIWLHMAVLRSEYDKSSAHRLARDGTVQILDVCHISCKDPSGHMTAKPGATHRSKSSCTAFLPASCLGVLLALLSDTFLLTRSLPCLVFELLDLHLHKHLAGQDQVAHLQDTIFLRGPSGVACMPGMIGTVRCWSSWVAAICRGCRVQAT